MKKRNLLLFIALLFMGSSIQLMASTEENKIVEIEQTTELKQYTISIYDEHTGELLEVYVNCMLPLEAVLMERKLRDKYLFQAISITVDVEDC